MLVVNDVTSTQPSAQAAAELLVRAHADDIWRYIRRRVATNEDADDLAADVFSVAWRRAAHELPTEEQRLWLFGVARRIVAAHGRAAHRRSGLLTRLAPTATPIQPPDLAERDALARALAQLPERDREVLLLRAWDGLSVGEIATLLQVTPNAVSVRLSKTRRRLAAALGDSAPPDAPAPHHPPRPDDLCVESS